MTQEEKDLVLSDLCARLPYIVKVKAERIHKDLLSFIGVDDNSYICKTPSGSIIYIPFNFDVKPYLRPMSSMTEEEAVEYCDLQDKFLLSSQYPVTDGYALFDWLNKKMFDFRGLIPKDLALSTDKYNPYSN